MENCGSIRNFQNGSASIYSAGKIDRRISDFSYIPLYGLFKKHSGRPLPSEGTPRFMMRSHYFALCGGGRVCLIEPVVQGLQGVPDLPGVAFLHCLLQLRDRAAHFLAITDRAKQVPAHR